MTTAIDRDELIVRFSFSDVDNYGAIWAGVEGFPGCWVVGDTVDEVVEGIRQNLSAYLSNNPPAAEEQHVYLSEACRHGVHDHCPGGCGQCGAPCVCGCHRPENH